YGLVKRDHLILQSGRSDKPRIERIIQHGLIRTPAVRIGVFVLLYAECFVFFLEDYRNDHIRRLVVGMALIFVSIVLDVEVIATKRFVCADVVLLDRLCESITDGTNKATMTIDRWNFVPIFILYRDGRNAVLLCKSEVVGPERWRCMHDTGTVFRRYEIAGHHSKCLVGIVEWLYIGYELFIADSDER